jgi:outer membrane protein assembly factor BamB
METPMALEKHAEQSGRSGAFSRFQRNLAITLICIFIALSSFQLAGQEDSSWRISPEKINIQTGADRVLQLLDDSAQELHGAEWSVDYPTLADVREEDGRVVVHAKAAGTVRISATLNGEKRVREIKIWSQDQPPPPGTTNWGTHPIGREIGDIAAVPKPDGPNVFSLEQTANGNTYLRAFRDDGIQVWNWRMPEATRTVELVCGDWLGGALISANRSDSYTLYTVGNDGKLRWQHSLAGIRKAHAYNLQHLVHLLSQSADGLATTVTGLDEVTGEQKFELTVPASHQQLINVQKAGKQILCRANSVTSPLRTIASRLFVNIDGFAYVAFTQNEWTLAAPKCTPGSAIEPHDVSFARDEQVVLWQIHPDGTYRSSIVEQSKGSRPVSEPVSVASPTGGIIPDGLGGVLLSIRRSHNDIVDDAHGPPDEFVYRLNQEGDIVYKFALPRYDGKVDDEIVLGENNRGFATRGHTLIAFDVPDGKEIWRWHSPQEIEVFAALANGACLVQTPTAVVEVENAATSKEVFEGKAMVDWQGRIFRKHN